MVFLFQISHVSLPVEGQIVAVLDKAYKEISKGNMKNVHKYRIQIENMISKAGKQDQMRLQYMVELVKNKKNSQKLRKTAAFFAGIFRNTVGLLETNQRAFWKEYLGAKDKTIIDMAIKGSEFATKDFEKSTIKQGLKPGVYYLSTNDQVFVKKIGEAGGQVEKVGENLYQVKVNDDDDNALARGKFNISFVPPTYVLDYQAFVGTVINIPSIIFPTYLLPFTKGFVDAMKEAIGKIHGASVNPETYEVTLPETVGGEELKNYLAVINDKVGAWCISAKSEIVKGLVDGEASFESFKNAMQSAKFKEAFKYITRQTEEGKALYEALGKGEFKDISTAISPAQLSDLAAFCLREQVYTSFLLSKSNTMVNRLFLSLDNATYFILSSDSLTDLINTTGVNVALLSDIKLIRSKNIDLKASAFGKAGIFFQKSSGKEKKDYTSKQVSVGGNVQLDFKLSREPESFLRDLAFDVSGVYLWQYTGSDTFKLGKVDAGATLVSSIGSISLNAALIDNKFKYYVGANAFLGPNVSVGAGFYNYGKINGIDVNFGFNL